MATLYTSTIASQSKWEQTKINWIKRVTVIFFLFFNFEWGLERNTLPATNNDVCADRTMVVDLLRSVIVSLLSSSPFHVYCSMNLYVMKVPMCSVTKVVIGRHHQVIVAIPEWKKQKTEQKRVAIIKMLISTCKMFFLLFLWLRFSGS